MAGTPAPTSHGGTNFWPPSYSRQDATSSTSAASEGCADITPDPAAHVRGKFGGGGYVNDGIASPAASPMSIP